MAEENAEFEEWLCQVDADMRESVDVFHGRLPHARAELIAGAGHLAPLETPEAFRALLLDFLG